MSRRGGRERGDAEARALFLLVAVLVFAVVLGWTVATTGSATSPASRESDDAGDGPPRLEGPGAGPDGSLACTAPDGSAGRTLIVRAADEAGAPVKDALVYLLGVSVPGTDELDARTPRARTAADGSASFGVEGTFALGVQAPGFVPHVERVDLSCGDARAVDVMLRRGGRITGRIQSDAAGIVAEDARVYVRSEAEAGVRLFDHPGLGGSVRVSGVVFADPRAGSFVAEGLPPGRYTLQGEAPAFLGGEAASARPGDDVTIRLAASARLTVRFRGLSGGARDLLQGVVRRREDGDAVIGFSRRGVVSELEVADGLGPGDYEIEVEHVGPEGVGVGQGTAAFQVQSPGEAVAVEVDLSPLLVVAFESSDGLALDGYLSVEEAGSGRARLHELRGAPGYVALRPGRHRIAYVDVRRVARPRDVEIRAGSESRETLALERATRVRVRAAGPLDLSVADRDGSLRPVAVFRGAVPRRTDERVVVQAGDLCVIAPEAGLVLRIGDDGRTSFPLDPGRDHVLADDGLHVEEGAEDAEGR